MTASSSSAAPADIPPAADAAAFQPRSRVGVVATGASSAPPANRTDTGLAFGDAPAFAPAPAVPVVAAPPSGTTIPAHQLSETPEVKQARQAVKLAEGRLRAARTAGGASDADLKKLQLEVASSKLALVEASGEPIKGDLRCRAIICEPARAFGRGDRRARGPAQSFRRARAVRDGMARRQQGRAGPAQDERQGQRGRRVRGRVGQIADVTAIRRGRTQTLP
jgi:hypothetical protein